MSPPSLLVLGGNGFLGSRICRAAMPHFGHITSLSRSATPPPNAQSWSQHVTWTQGDVFDLPPELLANADAVVCTLGVLLEGDYKSSPGAFLKELWNSRKTNNPLGRSAKKGSVYQNMNHDAALSAYKAYQNAAAAVAATKRENTPHGTLDRRRAFVYLSAEDTFRPLIPEGYIRSKRQAEADLARATESDSLIKPIFLRPSLIVDSKERPLTKAAEILLSASAHLQSALPPALRAQTHAQLLSWLTSHPDAKPPIVPPAYESLANLLSIPPVQVDTVANAAVQSILQTLRGESGGTEPQVLGVPEMQAMQKGEGRPHPHPRAEAY